MLTWVANPDSSPIAMSSRLPIIEWSLSISIWAFLALSRWDLAFGVLRLRFALSPKRSLAEARSLSALVSKDWIRLARSSPVLFVSRIASSGAEEALEEERKEGRCGVQEKRRIPGEYVRNM